MKDESLSALLDGECSPNEVEQLLQEFERTPALRERFNRMCMARELLRGARVRKIPADFSARVMAALPEQPDPAAKVTPLRPGHARPATPVAQARAARWRPVAGLAAAAAVGALAVLVLEPEAEAPAVVVVPTPVAAATPDAAEAALAQRVTHLEADQQRQLRNYLMAYSQSRAQQGMGTLGYARYAAYTEAQPPAGDPQALQREPPQDPQR